MGKRIFWKLSNVPAVSHLHNFCTAEATAFGSGEYTTSPKLINLEMQCFLKLNTHMGSRLTWAIEFFVLMLPFVKLARCTCRSYCNTKWQMEPGHKSYYLMSIFTNYTKYIPKWKETLEYGR